MSLLNALRNNVFVYWKTFIIILTPILFLPIPLVYPSSEAKCGYILIILAIYWSTEALPIPVTSLLPVVLLPLAGIMSTNEVCPLYMKHTNMMLLGSIGMAIAVEHCGLHQRIALFIILHVGQSPRRLLAGFMITTMFLSMWISNTASAALMVPITEAIIIQIFSNDDEKNAEVVESTDMTVEPISKNPPVIVVMDESSNVVEEVSKHDVKAADDIHKEASNDSTLTKELDETKSTHVHEQTLSNKIDDSTTDNNALQDNSLLSGHAKQIRLALMLGVAYGANIGGTGTITGTGPNLFLYGFLDKTFSEPTGLNYATWMAFNIPGMILAVLLGWLWLQLYCFGIGKYKKIDDWSVEKVKSLKMMIRNKIKALGSFTFHEAVVLVLFVLLVLLWFFRAPEFIPGWGQIFIDAYGEEYEVNDATPTFLIFTLLYIIPKSLNFWCFRDPSKPATSTPSCLDWKIIQEKMVWGVFLLLGGGFAMAEAAEVSGLSVWLGEQLGALDVMPTEAIVFIVALMVTFLTEVTSNSATASIIIPVLNTMALNINVNPLFLTLPASVCCSYAFMLPVATPPNAIVFSAAKMRSIEMIIPGLVMNFLCIGVITLTINVLGIPLFHVDTFPDWANSTIT